MKFTVLLSFFVAGMSALMALAALMKKPRTLAHWSFAAGFVLLGIESSLTGLSIRARLPEDVLFWQRLRVASMSFLPGMWLLFSLTYSRGNYRDFLRSWRWLLIPIFLLPPILLLGFYGQIITKAVQTDPGSPWVLVLGWSGKALYLLFVVTAVLILMNLERTFRAGVGTMRWRIKFMVLGLVLLFGVRIYTASQFLVFSAVNLNLAVVNEIGLLLAGILIARSLLREGLFQVDVYPSQTVIHGSLTVVVAGLYLLVVGVLAQIVSRLGGDTSFPVKAFIVLLSLVALAILLLSDRVRQHTRRFVSRHFKRPHYDYRKVWATYTKRTTSLMDNQALCRAVTAWISETFDTLTVTIWLHEQERLVYAASTSLTKTNAPPSIHLEPALLHSLYRLGSSPVDIDASTEKWLNALKESNPDHFRKGGHRLCVPIIASGELMGVMAVGDRINGASFTVEDMDLLKCISDQFAGNLLAIRLSKQLLQSKEMEAFQTMSAFFVHDLKNTANALSLMLQNMRTHFENPEFRKDALQTVSSSVSRINELIGRLALLREQLAVHKVETDLNQLVEKCLSEIVSLPHLNLRQSLQPIPTLFLDRDQFHKVLSNLLVNAYESLGKDGEIFIETSQRDGWAVLSVSDNGCGMSSEFVRDSLFRPFQTTKKTGVGIGMFLSKKIVDAHCGKLEVESNPGTGTRIRILLPLTNTDIEA